MCGSPFFHGRKCRFCGLSLFFRRLTALSHLFFQISGGRERVLGCFGVWPNFPFFGRPRVPFPELPLARTFPSWTRRPVLNNSSLGQCGQNYQSFCRSARKTRFTFRARPALAARQSISFSETAEGLADAGNFHSVGILHRRERGQLGFDGFNAFQQRGQRVGYVTAQAVNWRYKWFQAHGFRKCQKFDKLVSNFVAIPATVNPDISTVSA